MPIQGGGDIYTAIGGIMCTPFHESGVYESLRIVTSRYTSMGKGICVAFEYVSSCTVFNLEF